MSANNKHSSLKQIKNYNFLYNYLSIILISASIGLFYLLNINIWFKWIIVLISIIISITIFLFFSTTGLNLHSYFKDTWRELHKVVWPTRKESIQFTWIVFLFVLILGLFLWLLDSSISWLFYSVILRRNM